MTRRRSKIGGKRAGRPPLGAAARSVRLQVFVTPAVDARLSVAAKAATQAARAGDPDAREIKPTTIAADMLERALDATTEPTT